MNWMKQVATVLLVGFLAGSLASCGQSTERSPMAEKVLVERGKSLVATGGCHACHTPKIFTDAGPVPDSTRALSGHPQDDLDIPKLTPEQVRGGWIQFNRDQTCWVGPWGVSFAPNLTSDMETGLGSWTEDMFISAMRRGRHLGSGRTIMGPMPMANLNLLTDQDLSAIFTYLQSLGPVVNRAPDPILPNKLD